MLFCQLPYEYYQQRRLTEAAVLLIQLSFLTLRCAPSEQPVAQDVEVAEDDERWRQDGPVMERHDELIPLELPHLVGDGLDFKESVAADQRSKSCEHAP